MSDDLEFIVIDDIPEYIFCIGDDEENEQVIAISGKDGAFKYEKVDELPTAGEDGVLYLVPKSHTAQTASGNPINVNITDNAGKIESLKLDGDTFQQTYTGKNLVATTRIAPQTQNGVTCTWDGASFTLDGTSTASVDFYGRGWWGATSDPIVLPAGTYTMSLRKSDGSLAADVAFSIDCYYGTNHIIGIYRGNSGAGYRTETFDSDTQYAVLFVSLPSGRTYNNEKFYVQLEKSESPTAYEPFVGGQPSPNPSYPQDINVVTGTQTISINGTNYPISLGSLELCGLGDDGNGNPLYKDRIYRDGEDWKVHKATETKVLNGSDSEDWTALTHGGYTYELQTALPAPNSPSKLLVLSGYFFGIPYDNRTQNIPNSIYLSDTGRKINIRNTAWTTVEQFKTWLASNNTTVYYALETPTDTTITDTNLIAQLEAIRTAALESGSNTISNTATGTNLAGDLEIGYYGYDPLNKYDKYFWLDVDGAYESL